MHKHLIIVSHRRSGTHLAIDAIGNNFSRYSPCFAEFGQVTLEEMLVRCHSYKGRSAIMKGLASGPRIIKTHSHCDVPRFFKDTDGAASFAQELFNSSHVIYIYRNPVDVLWSLFHYQSSWDPAVLSNSFSEYIRQNNQFDSETYDGDMERIDYWMYHLQGWLSNAAIFHIAFEDLLKNYQESLERIGRYLECSLPKKICDIRPRPYLEKLFSLSQLKIPFVSRIALRAYQRMAPRLKKTSVCFRRGRIGDGIRNCPKQDLDYLRTKTSDFWRPPIVNLPRF